MAHVDRIMRPSIMESIVTFLHNIGGRRAASRPAATLLPRNDHMARDAGLSAGEAARLLHQWPSETQVHPRW